jgi:ribosomal protein S18 acetylase RimI-like enzyme
VLHIGLIAVDEAARGKGIGSVLLNWVFNYATLHGFKQVNVVTQAANTGALNFYEQHGFEIISRTFLYHVWKLN